MTTWNYYNWCGQVRETDTGLLVADITMRPNDEEIGTLAAAAPELLEALEALLVHLEDTGVDLNDCEDECRAAIAKATGGEVGS